MMFRATFGRRRLMANVIGGGMAWLRRHDSFLARLSDHVRWMSGYGALAAVCGDLGNGYAIGRACLETLPARDVSKGFLTGIILGDVRSAGGGWSSKDALARSIREVSRDDFRNGRIVIVDGWMLSLTETRVYALAALLREQGATGG